jgi:hypothetical protein
MAVKNTTNQMLTVEVRVNLMQRSYTKKGGWRLDAQHASRQM